MKRKTFEQLVREGITSLPAQAKAAMVNVAFVIEKGARRPPSLPSTPRLRKVKESYGRAGKKENEIGIRIDEVLLGLYEGISKTNRGTNYFGVLPDKITIFQKPIEELAGRDEKKLKKIICEVVWHEVGHHLGFDEKEIRALEIKKRRK